MYAGNDADVNPVIISLGVLLAISLVVIILIIVLVIVCARRRE